MLTHRLLALFMIAALALTGCDGSPDPDEDMTWGDHRQELSSEVETQLDRVESMLDDLGDAADDEAFDETRRMELERMRDELRADLDAMQNQSRETWTDFATEVQRHANHAEHRLDMMSDSMK